MTAAAVERSREPGASPKRLARTAGVLYLLVVAFGAFAHLYIRTAAHVPGDAATTSANIVDNAALFRLGLAFDLAMAVCFLFVSMALYRLLKHVHEDAARAMVLFVAVSVAIICLNLVHHAAALLLTGEPYATGFAGSDHLVLLMLDMHQQGYLIAQLFFGLWLLPLGYLVHQSNMFPRILGIVLIIGCFSHLADMFAQFLIPELAPGITEVIKVPANVAEFWMIGYLLIRGVKPRRPLTPHVNAMGKD